MKLSNRLGIFLISLQIADAVLTCWGVNTFGIRAEGNPIIRYLISLIGVELALTLAKIVAVVCIYFLAKVKANNILLFLSGLYTSVVLMWLISYFQH